MLNLYICTHHRTPKVLVSPGGSVIGSTPVFARISDRREAETEQIKESNKARFLTGL